jgi:hypothetical protein
MDPLLHALFWSLSLNFAAFPWRLARHLSKPGRTGAKRGLRQCIRHRGAGPEGWARMALRLKTS